MGMTYARLRVAEIKMVPNLYFASVPPGLYALWWNNNDAIASYASYAQIC